MGSLPQGILRVLAWFDSTADELKAVINDDGELPVSVENLPTTMQSRLYGWDLTNWRKLPLLFGYQDVVAENLGGTAVAAQYAATSTVVPSGYIHRIESIFARNNSRAATICHVYYVIDGVFMYPKSVSTLGQYIPINFVGPITLNVNDYVGVILNGCTIGDTIQAGVSGYQMKINE